MYAILLGILALATAGAWGAASGDSYPRQPIRLLVPNPPGGGSDALARILGTKLGETMGQQIVIDNRAGGGGIIATELGARAAPDGYTLLMAFIGPMVVSPSLVRTPYDPVRDFVPVTLVAAAQYLMAVHPSVPAKTLKELVSYAKANPGRINYASAGNGTPLHLAGELFKSRAGVDLVHVPYKGGGPAAAAVLGGEAQLIFGSITSTLPQVKAGKLVALGVTGAARSPVAPDYPTIVELGYPGYAVTSWYGIVAPLRTPPAVITRLHAAITDALRSPDVAEQMKRQGLDSIGSTPAQFGAFIKAEVAKWAQVVKEAGIKAD